ncbi:MAG: AraC family transcriptional regulator CmrA [Gemmatimonadetes bacterium]|nr:MAG: AraC family transcriptional regulator CmrA [Gemmatimonadota bacterium]
MTIQRIRGTILQREEPRVEPREELARRIARRVTEDGTVEAAPGLRFFRSSGPAGPVYAVSRPCFCVVAQGSKEVALGAERYRYDGARYLLVSAGLPLVGHVIEASKERPYLAMALALDPAVVTAVLIETGLLAPRADGDVRALTVSQLDANLLDAVVRLVRLLDSPADYGVLAPLVVREIVYRLLIGDQGDRLRQIAVIDGRVHRIAKAIEILGKDRDKPLRIADIARQLGMSVSGLHSQFKAVTGMSPLQFQKQLRLQEARRLLLAGEVDVARAGYRVGYDDASHFSREYKRLFGEPPMRDLERLQGLTAARHSFT